MRDPVVKRCLQLMAIDNSTLSEGYKKDDIWREQIRLARRALSCVTVPTHRLGTHNCARYQVYAICAAESSASILINRAAQM